MIYVYKEIQGGRTYYVCEEKDEKTNLYLGTCDLNLDSAARRMAGDKEDIKNRFPSHIESNEMHGLLAEPLSKSEFERALDIFNHNNP